MKSSASGPDKMRLQLFLARSGLCSRRQAMTIILQGRVTVNGAVNREPSTPVDPRNDAIKVDEKLIQQKDYKYILLNKPAGYVTTKKDPHAKKTVFDLIPQELAHLMPVGRLDKDTEGLLIFTNDGSLTQRLTHPRFSIKKTYFAKIEGMLKKDERRKLEEGIPLEGRKTAPARIKLIKLTPLQSQLTIEVQEGRKRQIRLMFAHFGHPVIYLKRIALGPLRLEELKTGQWRYLNAAEIKELHSL